jgi:hypothetical protein
LIPNGNSKEQVSVNNTIHPDSTRPFTLFVIIAGAVLVGGSGTLLLQRLLGPQEDARPFGAPPTEVVVDPRLAQAMSLLVYELRESRASVAQLPTPAAEASPRRSVAGPDERTLADLISAVNGLRDAFRQGSAGASGASQPALFPPPDDRRAWLPDLPADVQDRERAHTRQHLFWSEQQVLNRYGTPDTIRIIDNVAVWSYEDESEDGARSFYVRVYQGRVIGVGG